ncbi:MAG: Asp-tRNA(Asn)/Glu-tRNA(Gln) amidotransferase subunit GatA [bacterium]|nr:Asp-tRNA(Asn)/Glu-tRNA(Gln) amidotransferase subunit GatA [bacterium]
MFKVSKATVLEITQAIKNREVTAEGVLDGFYENIALKDKEINAFIAITKDLAYQKAKEIDLKITNGEKVGKLAGVPIAIKDNINILDERMTCGSKILADFKSPYNATVIERLAAEDAIFIGKTNMDEFAMGSSCETSYFGPTKNPVNLEYIPGGSSGGSAAAVAADFAPVALGSDTGGSIRQPAALCGVYGLKPTYGAVSRYGLTAFASSLDQIGPFAKSAADTAFIFDIISGHDIKDSTSAELDFNISSELENFNIKGLKIGLPTKFFGEGLNREVKNTVLAKIEELKNKGAEIKELEMPHADYAIAAYYILAPSEASSNLSRFDGVKYGFRAENIKNLMEEYTKTRAEGFGDEVKRRIMIGTYALSSGYYDAYYLKAQKMRTLIKEDYDKAFEAVDVIITPTTPDTAFKLGEKTGAPLAMYLSDIYTISINLAGIPALSMPIGNDSKNLPIGMQIIAPHFQESRILGLASFMERML